jgi:hypothetical protein
MARTTSSPLTIRPKAAKPCPSGFLLPPKSSSGWSPIQLKKSAVAVSGAVAGHRDRAVLVLQPRVACPLQLDRRQLVLLSGRAQAGLDDAELHLVARLVAGPDRAVEVGPVVELAAHVAEEVGDGSRGIDGLQLQFDVALARLDEHAGRLALLGGLLGLVRLAGGQGDRQAGEVVVIGQASNSARPGGGPKPTHGGKSRRGTPRRPRRWTSCAA